MGNLFKKEPKQQVTTPNDTPTKAGTTPQPPAAGKPGTTYKFTVFNVGDLNVGKTSLALKFLGEAFNEGVPADYSIFDKKSKTLEVGNSTKCQLSFLDTAGQERFKTITNTPYQRAHIIMICFDITSRETFDNTSTWFTEANYNNSDALKVLVGMKADLLADRQVTSDEATALVKSKSGGAGGIYVETSAKTGHHVEYLLQKSCEELIKLIDEGVIDIGEDSN